MSIDQISAAEVTGAIHRGTPTLEEGERPSQGLGSPAFVAYGASKSTKAKLRKLAF